MVPVRFMAVNIRVLSSEMWHHVVWWKVTNSSAEPAASIWAAIRSSQNLVGMAFGF
jgi:hypothetical protein